MQGILETELRVLLVLGKHFTTEVFTTTYPTQLPVSTNTNPSTCCQATRKVAQHSWWQPCHTAICTQADTPAACVHVFTTKCRDLNLRQAELVKSHTRELWEES